MTEPRMATPKSPESPTYRKREGAEGDLNWPPYPQGGTHTWGEFAFGAIEAGGYRDLTWIDPWTGNRHWFAEILQGDEDVYTSLRRLIDRMEEQDVLGAHATD